MSPEPLWEVYIHEAGHAVVANALGFEYADVTAGVTPQCELHEKVWLTATYSAEWAAVLENTEPVVRRAVVCMAGGCAAVIAGFDPPGGVEEDMRQLLELYASLAPGRVTAHGWESEAQAQAYRDWREGLLCRAREILVERWSAVEAVATALQQRGRLTADELKEIIHRTLAQPAPDPCPDDGREP